MQTDVVPFVDLRRQFADLREEVVPEMLAVMESAGFILGPAVAAFEKQFAEYTGAQFCIGLESGTAALKVGLLALGIGAGDEVIVPANTFIASAAAVSAVGATPVLVDVDDHYLIDTALIEAAITPRTKAIMPVHLYGQVADMDAILEIAKRRNLYVVEDACQSHGALYKGRRAGSMGDFGAFSFYPGKNLGAYGDGGAVVTNSAAVADNVKLYRDFGQKKKYEHVIKGDNCRLDSLQAAVLGVKLRHIDAWNQNRRNAAAQYDALLAKAGIAAPKCKTPEGHVYHLYVVEVPDRDGVQKRLAENGIQTGIHYPIPIHLQPAYAELNKGEGDFPNTERAAKRILSLPMFPEIEPQQIARVVRALEYAVAAAV